MQPENGSREATGFPDAAPVPNNTARTARLGRGSAILVILGLSIALWAIIVIMVSRLWPV